MHNSSLTYTTSFQKIQNFVLIVMLPIILCWITYVGFLPSRLPQQFIFEKKIWMNYFSHGVFSTRILGLLLLHYSYLITEFLQTNHLLPNFILGGHIMPPDDFTFYYSLLFLNATFFILTNIVAYLIFSSKPFDYLSTIQKQALLLLINFLIAITQYVPMHYDTLFYFLEFTAMYYIFCKENFLMLVIIFIFALLTRETAAIIIAIFAANYIYRYGLSLNKECFKIIFLGVFFITGYLVLKHYFYELSAIVFEKKWDLNFLDHFFYACISVLFFICFFLLISKDSLALRRNMIFIIFCLPYLVPLPWIAALWEARIWIPVLLPMIVIAQLPQSL